MAAHWGTFSKDWNHREVLGAAANAITDHGLELYEKGDGGYLVIGGRGELLVQVTCVPEGNARTWVAVTACSPDSAQAEQARNSIREQIVRVVRFD